MKILLTGAAALSALALGGCGLFGMGAPETPPAIAAAPAALPPPTPTAALPPPATPAPPAATPAEPEPDLSGEVPVSEMKCIPGWTLKEVKLADGKTEMRCSPP